MGVVVVSVVVVMDRHGSRIWDESPPLRSRGKAQVGDLWDKSFRNW